MDTTRTFARLGDLPDRIAGPLRLALEKTQLFETTPRVDNAFEEERALYEPAFLAAGFSPHVPRKEGDQRTVPYSARAILMASELSAEQRTLAEIIAHVTGPDFTRWPIPAAAWVRRQWLGLEPAGPLFAIELNGLPAYHAVRDALHATSSSALSLLDALPTNEQIALLLDFYLVQVDCKDSSLKDALAKRGASIDGAAGEWARTTAKRVLALFAASTAETEKAQLRGVDVAMVRPIFLGLVRAGIPIEPAWYELLPLDPWTPEALLHECIDAIPEPSREEALAVAIPRVGQYSSLVALKLLPRYPYRRIAEQLLAKLSTLPDPKAVIATLQTLAAQNRGIAEALAATQAELDYAASFSVGPLRTGLALEEVSGVDRAQLEAAIRGEGEADEPILPAHTWTFRIDRQGAPAYDVWMLMVDSGVVFTTGTTEVVAEIIQGGIECGDRKLRMVLKDMLSDAGKKRAKAKAPSKPRKPAAPKKPKPKRSG
ncbi:MAG: hypothetical protein HOV80_04735 [Polyangiaceae bacterium]|nr:hypothetical protein [Polyangiaceae bacterium]